MEAPLVAPARIASSWVLPCVPTSWDGYTADELERRRRAKRFDWPMLVVFGLGYFLVAVCVAKPVAGLAAADTALPFWRACVRLLLAALASYVLAVDAVAHPVTGSDGLHAEDRMGRWVYLTRHVIALQALHQVFSVFSPWSPSLTVLTHGVSVCIGVLGWFVSVQFFVLVFPSALYQEHLRTWRERGVQLFVVDLVVHVPGLPLSILDLLIAKDAVVLSQAVSLPSTAAMVFFYTFFYLAVITVNHRLTGAWPYGIMDELGSDLGKWAAFIVGQVVVVGAFLAANVLVFFGAVQVMPRP